MKYLLIILLMLSLNSAFAYKYWVDKGSVWSQTKWKGAGNTDVPNRPPEAGDEVTLSSNMRFDTDLTLKKLHSYAQKLELDGKTLRITTDFSLNMKDITFNLKNAKLTVDGNFNYITHDKYTDISGAVIFLDDSSFDLRSSASLMVSAVLKNKQQAFNAIMLKGKSSFKMGGILALDDGFRNPESKIGYKFGIAEKDGNIPAVFVGGGDFTNVYLDVSLGATAKPGKYVIFTSATKKSELRKMVISLNGQPYELGKTVKAGALSAKINFVAGGQKGVAETLVLELK